MGVHEQSGFPSILGRLVLEMFAFQRCLTMLGAYADGMSTCAAILAGGCFATDALFVVLMPVCDALLESTPQASLCLYVDDLSLHAVAHEADLPAIITHITKEAIDRLEDGLGLRVSRGTGKDKRGKYNTGGKTKATASTRQLQKRIAPGMAQLGIATAHTVPHLGVDYAPARKPFRQKQKGRWTIIQKTQHAIYRALGIKAGLHVFRTGGVPALTHGASVYGVPSHQIRATQQHAADISGIKWGRSVSARLQVTHTDPASKFLLPSLQNWAGAVWESDPPVEVMEAAWRIGSRTVLAKQDPAAASTGPASAYLAVLFRVGWRAPAWHSVCTRMGYVLDLRLECPHTVTKYYMDDLRWVIAASSSVAVDFLAMHRGRATADGRRPDERDRSDRLADWPSAELNAVALPRQSRYPADPPPVPWFAPAAAAVAARGASALSSAGRALAVSLVEGGWWSPAAKKQAAMIEDDVCVACGHRPCDHRHLTIECPSLARAKAAFPQGQELFAHAANNLNDPLCVRGVPKQPALPDPPPEVERVERRTAPDDEPLVFTGHAFPDGAVSSAGPKAVWRGGWAAVSADRWGSTRFAIYGACAERYPTSFRSELSGALRILSLAIPPLIVWSDNAQVVRGFQRGRAWCTSASREGADLCRSY